ncbi:MAG: phosphoesterase, partial [Deltaproteobacteria bacterium]|nr:phosphoesterase [Deltaproteobacteria bacterium]
MARLKVFFHDACFDGTTSAALFSAFYRDVVDRGATVQSVGMVHKDGDPFDGVPLDADDHACVDFRFCADPRMRWWFDHHPTA